MAPMIELKENVFDLGKQKNVMMFVKNWYSIPNFFELEFKHRGPEMAMYTNNMEKPSMPEGLIYLYWKVKTSKVRGMKPHLNITTRKYMVCYYSTIILI